MVSDSGMRERGERAAVENLQKRGGVSTEEEAAVWSGHRWVETAIERDGKFFPPSFVKFNPPNFFHATIYSLSLSRLLLLAH